MRRITHDILSTFAFIALTTPHSSFAQEHDRAKTIQVEAQPLATALQDFSEQSGLQVAYVATLAENVSSKGAHNAPTPAAALTQILDSTGLEYQFVNADTVAIGPAIAAHEAKDQGNARTTPRPEMMAQASVGTEERTDIDQDREQPDRAANTQRSQTLEEIIVTGTRIRGAQLSSPLLTITQDDIKLSGYGNLGEALRALPQNFSGGQNPGVAFGTQANNSSNVNLAGASSLNLRGLGPDATLTLLNGARLPYEGHLQATDVAVVPVAAISRVDILLDGASAIYGSDAVAGVANIVLKRDYEGAEASLRYGTATDGGYEQKQFTGVAGTTWGSGGFLVAADVVSNTAVEARHRDYLAFLPNQRTTVYPDITQKGGLFSGYQRVGNSEISLDVFYTDRRIGITSQSTSTLLQSPRDSETRGVSSAWRFDLPKDWSLRLTGTLGSNEIGQHSTLFSVATGEQILITGSAYSNKAGSAGVEMEGPLFSLAGGDARLSFGGGYRKGEIEISDIVTGDRIVEGEDHSIYGFAELNLPLISEEQEVPLISTLSINGALRHEQYESFGNVTTPKLGAIWGVTPDFDIKASWGKSFKVPTLTQQHNPPVLFLYPPEILGMMGAPAGSAAFFKFGGNPDLGPERAVVVTAGFVVHPRTLPGLSLEMGWFDVDYTDRIVNPITPLSQGLVNPAFAEFITLNPTVAQQDATFAELGLPVGTFSGSLVDTYDPSAIVAIVDARYANASAQHVSGFDLTARYSFDIAGANLVIDGNASWMDGDRSLTSDAPELATVGVVFFPAKFKARLGATYSRGDFTFSSNVYYTDGVINTGLASRPKGGSMTTVDLVADYRLPDTFLGDIGLNIAIANAFDRHPPLIPPTGAGYVNFDSTNYSALGRTISGTLTMWF